MTRRTFLKKSLAVAGASIVVPYTMNWRPVKSEAATVTEGGKIIWNNMDYSNMPNMYATYGMPRIKKLQRSFYTTGWADPTVAPDESWYDGYVTNVITGSIGTGIVDGWFMFDHEEFSYLNGAARLTTGTYWYQIYNGLKSRVPSLKFGFFGGPMVYGGGQSAFYAPLTDVAAWQAMNNQVAASGIYGVIDALFPPIYMHCSRATDPLSALDGNGRRQDISNAQLFMERTIAEQYRLIKAYGKGQKVYPVTSENDGPTGTVALDSDVYQLMLRMAMGNADGMVVFAGAGDWNTASTLSWWTNGVLPIIQSGRYAGRTFPGKDR